MNPIHALLSMSVPSFILNPLVSIFLPAIAGTITAVVYQWVKKSSDWVNALPAQVHVYAVGFIAIALPQIAKSIPGFGATSLDGIDMPAVQSAVLFGLSQLTHKLLAGPTPAATK